MNKLFVLFVIISVIEAVSAETELDHKEEAVFVTAGWVKQGEVMIPSGGSENVLGIRYQKRIGNREIDAIRISQRNLISFSLYKHRVFMRGRVLSFSWLGGSNLAVVDDNVFATQEELKTALDAANERWAVDRSGMIRVRNYKGVFGLVTIVTEPYAGEVRDRRVMLWLLEARPKGDRIELLLSSGGDKPNHTLEIDSEMGYISSSVSGKTIPKGTVEVGPILDDAVYHRERLKKAYGTKSSE